MPEVPGNDDVSQKQEFNIASGNFSSDEVALAKDIIARNENLFSYSDSDIGHVTSVKHRIEMTDIIPFKQRHRRIPPSMFNYCQQE